MDSTLDLLNVVLTRNFNLRNVDLTGSSDQPNYNCIRSLDFMSTNTYLFAIKAFSIFDISVQHITTYIFQYFYFQKVKARCQDRPGINGLVLMKMEIKRYWYILQGYPKGWDCQDDLRICRLLRINSVFCPFQFNFNFANKETSLQL